MHSPANAINHFLSRLLASELRAWRGDAPLGPVFWIQGVVFSCWLIAVNALALQSEHFGLLQVLILIDVCYTIWILVAIWRCSSNATPFWGDLARWLTIAWGLNTFFVLLFVQIELLRNLFTAG